MIKGFCNVGRLEDAFGLHKAMRGHGCASNAVSYATLPDGICKLRSMEMAQELSGEMEKKVCVGHKNVQNPNPQEQIYKNEECINTFDFVRTNPKWTTLILN